MIFKKYSKLKKLSEGNINEIIDIYYNTDKSEVEIMEQFEIKDVEDGKLHNHFPRIMSKELKCSICYKPLVLDRLPRDLLDKKNYYYCADCIEFDECYCERDQKTNEIVPCGNCDDKFNSEYDAKEEKSSINFYATFNYIQNKKFRSKDLNLKQAIYLISHASLGMNIDHNSIDSISNSKNDLGINLEYSKIIIDQLLEDCLIYPDFSLGPYYSDEALNYLVFTWDKEYYSINLSSEEDLREFLESRIEFAKLKVTNYEAIDLWKEIIYWECVELINRRMKASGYTMTINDELKKELQSALNIFPLSVLYPMIWRISKNIKQYFKNLEVSNNKLQTSFINRFRNITKSIFLEEKQISKYNVTDYSLKSNISYIYFNIVLEVNPWDMIPGDYSQ